MYKPQFKKNNDIYAIVDHNGEMSYISFSAFWLIQDTMKPRRVDLAFSENSLIDDKNFTVIKRFGDSFTQADFCQALDSYLEDIASNDTLIELYKRLPKVLSVNLLIL